MTDYTNWTAKEGKLLFGPIMDTSEDWTWVIEYDDGSIGPYCSDVNPVETYLQPPEPEWIYARRGFEIRGGEPCLMLIGCEEHRADVRYWIDGDECALEVI
jgi:hypothetical protein